MKGKPLRAEPGQVFNRWTLIEPMPAPSNGSWRARCECGNERTVKLAKVVSGWSKSCGCYKRQVTQARMRTHGHSPRGVRTAEHRIWMGLRNRCNNPNNAKFHRYGGRGIRVANRWDSFENFLTDMGPRPSKRHTIERVDNDGNYEPKNCRWATNREQARNRRTNHPITLRGETLLITEWAERTGLPDHVIGRRIRILGWDVEKALTTPLARPNEKRTPQFLTFNGETRSIIEWARLKGMRYETLRQRVNTLGWSIERALTTSPRSSSR